MNLETPMCACGHTISGHCAEGCLACAGPPCDIQPREAVARVLYAAFGLRDTGRQWDDLGSRPVRDLFYRQADLVLEAAEAYS